MADLLGLITGLGTAATNIGNEMDAGIAERRKAARDDLLARIEQERQDADAAVRRDYMTAQTRTMNAPKPPRTQVVDGMLVDMHSGVARPIQGMPQVGGQAGPQGTPAKPYEERNEGGGVAIYENGRFKSWKIRPPVEREPNPAVTAAADQRTFAREQSLAGDFRQEPIIKDAYGIDGAVTTIRGALQNPSGQGDIAAIYALVKLYDPGSVVKEGEIQLAQSAASLPEQVQRLVGGWNTGRRLTPQMRAQIGAIADNLVKERQLQVNPVLARYGQQARRWGADSAFVAPNPLANASAPSNQVQTSTGRTFTRPQ